MLKVVLLSFALAISAITPLSHAAQTWTYTVKGHLVSGSDLSGALGVGSNFAGLEFTQTTTSSVDPSLWESHLQTPTTLSVYGLGPGFTSTLTLGDHVFSFTTLSNTFGAQAVQIEPTGYNQVSTRNIGLTSDGYTVESEVSVMHPNTVFLNSVSYTQTLAVDIISNGYYSDTFFAFSKNGAVSLVRGQVDQLFLNPVPEPETYALMLAGIGLVGVVASRRKQA